MRTVQTRSITYTVGRRTCTVARCWQDDRQIKCGPDVSLVSARLVTAHNPTSFHYERPSSTCQPALSVPPVCRLSYRCQTPQKSKNSCKSWIFSLVTPHALRRWNPKGGKPYRRMVVLCEASRSPGISCGVQTLLLIDSYAARGTCEYESCNIKNAIFK